MQFSGFRYTLLDLNYLTIFYRIWVRKSLSVKMAVLKSQITTRNKKRWAKQYALKSFKLNYKAEERVHLRTVHRLQTFLRDSAPMLKLKALAKKTTHTKSVRPPVIIRCGSQKFDSTVTNPVIFRQHFRLSSSRKRLFVLVNSSKILSKSKKIRRLEK